MSPGADWLARALFNEPKDSQMNPDRIQRNWKQVAGKAKEQWGRLTEPH
jgi:hypothetical protein